MSKTTKEKELIKVEEKKIEELERAYKELESERKALENSYAQLQESKDALIRSERLAFTGRIAASIAHEIRNPLANVTMALDRLRKVSGEDYQGAKQLDIITRNIQRTNYLITELLNCARPPKLNIKLYDIHKILKTVLDTTKAKLKLQKIKVIKKFTSKPSTMGLDKEHIQRVFLNLCLNAIEAMPKGGELTISTELKDNFFVVKIQDAGSGIADKDIIRIFDPFYSTRSEGVGLGLTVCQGIVVSHGGIIEVTSKLREGTTFIVSLPFEQKLHEAKMTI